MVARAHKDFGELLHRIYLPDQFERQFPSLTGIRPGQRIERDFMDQMRGFLRSAISTRFGRRHKDHATRTTVNYRAEVQFFADVGRRFNPNLVYRLVN